MKFMYCALGCSTTKNLYYFPNRKHDSKRRKAWLDFFDLEEPNVDYVYACEKHFSNHQTNKEGVIRADAVPDVPITCVGSMPPFRRKPKNWRKNVVVVTPRDPEFIIYRHETGVFPQQLFDIPDAGQSVIQVPMIKSVSCSMSTQTDPHLCGLVEISDIRHEYRLNCFYCNETFDIEKWSNFVNHIKTNHYAKEEAFKRYSYLTQDHDYASKSTCATLQKESSSEFCRFINPVIHLPLPQKPAQQVAFKRIKVPPLFPKPNSYFNKTQESSFESVNILPPPLLANPHQSNDKKLNISLADKLINLLNQTVLSPNFLRTEEDNILVIKNTSSENIEMSTFLESIMPIGNARVTIPAPKRSKTTQPHPKYSRPVHTINYGEQNVPSMKHSLSRILFPPLPKSKRDKLVRTEIAQQTLKSINVFENVYKTIKKRYPKVEEVENNALNDAQMEKQTILQRCLKRSLTEEISKKQNDSEIVFEYTPEAIVLSLLENMKNYPVLWKFHDKPFNKDYNKAIGELCSIINEKWDLNISYLKMRRSTHRILRFYRFLFASKTVDQFQDYFDKCALFLPSADAIPRSRCVYCCLCFKKDSSLRRHILQQHKSLKWPYKCKRCFERFYQSDEFELHQRLSHYEEIFKCERCDKRFYTRYLYNKHVATHQERIDMRTKPTIYKCDVCNNEYKSPADLRNHKVFHNITRYICHICSKELTTKMSLTFHLKRHNQQLDYMCEVCGKGFIRKHYLLEHMNKHTGTKITCNICHLKLRRCSLNRHLRLVHVATEGTIESTFRAKSHRYKKFIYPRQKSLRCSKGPRQYDCKICKIPFDRLKHLKDHNKLSHADVKRTPCKICNIEFLHIHNLKRHYRAKHKLHNYQVLKLVDQNEDLNTVLQMDAKELEAMTAADCMIYAQQSSLNSVDNYFEQGRMHSDKIQDEIMKAVENLDDQEVKVDDDHSMNEFFTDFFKQ